MQQRITEITKRLHEKERQRVEAERKMNEAEQAAAQRDKNLAEIISRIRKYEQVLYPLYMPHVPVYQ